MLSRITRSATRAFPFRSRWSQYGVYLPGKRCHPFSTHPLTRLWWQYPKKESGNEEKTEGQDDHIPPFAPSDGEEVEHLPSRRVHIMGFGGMGVFVAHSLMCLPNPPPISLLMHSEEMYTEFQHRNRILRVINQNSGTNDEQTGFDVDVAFEDPATSSFHWRFIAHNPTESQPPPSPNPEELLPSGEVRIYTLILCGRGGGTVRAIRSIKHRIGPETTICILQNGLGQVEELNGYIFTDPETRPTYMLGAVSHRVRISNSFAAVHAGVGSTAIGLVRDLDRYPLPPKSDHHTLSEFDKKKYYPTRDQLWANISSRYLLRTLTRSPILVCAALPYLDLFQLQLERLAVNCIVGSLTALMDVPNGALTSNVKWTTVARLLITEISAVIQRLPELQGLPNARNRFSADSLEKLYVQDCRSTAEQSSSTREDVRKLKRTEVNYHNGYIVRRGEELGLRCVLNYLIQNLVEGKSWLSFQENEFSVPFSQRETLLETTKAPTVSVPAESLSQPKGNDLENDGMPKSDRAPLQTWGR